MNQVRAPSTSQVPRRRFSPRGTPSGPPPPACWNRGVMGAGAVERHTPPRKRAIRGAPPSATRLHLGLLVNFFFCVVLSFFYYSRLVSQKKGDQNSENKMKKATMRARLSKIAPGSTRIDMLRAAEYPNCWARHCHVSFAAHATLAQR